MSEKSYKVDGLHWTATCLSDVCNIAYPAARNRLERHKRGLISRFSLFAQGNQQAGQKSAEITVKGITYTTEMIVELTKVSRETARRRMSLVKSGKMTVEELFTVGKIIKKSKHRTVSDATDEYKALSDSEKTCKPLRPLGTWEREQLKKMKDNFVPVKRRR